MNTRIVDSSRNINTTELLLSNNELICWLLWIPLVTMHPL